jgi:hypothetical protein
MKHALTIVFLAVALFSGLRAQEVQASGGEWYLVQQGDSLASIASIHGISLDELLAANNLSWDAWIRAGQQLVIPRQVGSPTVPPGPPPRSPWQTDFVESATDAFPRQYTPWSPWWVDVDANPYPGSGVDPHPYRVNDSPPQAPSPERWIDVDLTSQTLTAYEGQEPVFNVAVSTGTWQYPTVVGTFAIYVKFEKARMRGGSGVDAYDLPDVPYVMYFHKGYGLHGTYWHDNFGTPMSHGCVNLSMVDSEWLFNWASVGTKVVSHY